MIAFCEYIFDFEGVYTEHLQLLAKTLQNGLQTQWTSHVGLMENADTDANGRCKRAFTASSYWAKASTFVNFYSVHTRLQ